MDTRETTSIVHLLQREIGILESFVALLNREHQLLSSGSTNGLAELANEKSDTAVELSQLASARDEALKRIDLPVGRAGMDAWTLSSAGVAYQRQWDRLRDLAGEARALNTANGKAINLQMQHNQQALTVLLAAANQAATYGPDGQPKCPPGSRSLGSA